jgi:hypothetical protein
MSHGARTGAYDAFERGLAFGRKELARIESKRKDQLGAAPAVDAGGSGLTYDEYGQGVLNAHDPYAKLSQQDRATYGPPPHAANP